ncbi:MAG TPA: DUF3795 domain-containing protein [Candidatus Kapabacteria bacterium]|nr:DUF3795 domain-containing protein [Candidatus Kapabacteria bacterium]
MISYCGIECLECESYLATQSEKYEELERVAKKLSELYHTEVKAEFIICDGCREDARHSFFCSNLCKMRKCCNEKEIYSCIDCSDFPCTELQQELNHVPNAMENLLKIKKIDR